jgi:hypothetical protein
MAWSDWLTGSAIWLIFACTLYQQLYTEPGAKIVEGPTALRARRITAKNFIK